MVWRPFPVLDFSHWFPFQFSVSSISTCLRDSDGQHTNTNMWPKIRNIVNRTQWMFSNSSELLSFCSCCQCFFVAQKSLQHLIFSLLIQKQVYQRCNISATFTRVHRCFGRNTYASILFSLMGQICQSIMFHQNFDTVEQVCYDNNFDHNTIIM